MKCYLFPCATNIECMQYSIEQQLAFEKYIAKRNILITGPGGTGKTSLIRHIYKDATDKMLHIQVTALTGAAAILLECKAKTIHSWAGVGLGTQSAEDHIVQIRKNRTYLNRWKTIHLLVIDEVSMMSLQLFELLDSIGKAIRRNMRPFGGIQLILSGDFLQLPPIGSSAQFCFESPLWGATFLEEDHVFLKTIFRQTDEEYQSILNQIRVGKIKRSTNQRLLDMVGKACPDQLIKPTKLQPRRSQVDYINEMEMRKLEGDVYEFTMKNEYNIPDYTKEAGEEVRRFTPEQIHAELERMRKNVCCDEVVRLKVGAQVMCLANVDLNALVYNGSQGVVTGICVRTGYPMVLFRRTTEPVRIEPFIWKSTEIPKIGISQIPLILAWAITIHKSQGATLDMAEIDVGPGIFECGQTYVALSRVKSLEGLYLQSFDARQIRVNKKAQEFYMNLESSSNATINVQGTGTEIVKP